MTKKQPRNSFYFFMIDFKTREEAIGNYYANMQEVSTAAGKIWQTMSATDKKPYEIKAKEMKNKASTAKFTSTGENVEVVMNREREQEMAEKMMKESIEALVRNGNDFETKNFYVAHVSHYCYCNTVVKHIPAEISIVRFNLRDGIDIDDIYHVIYNPERIPVGYMHASIMTSEETHNLPIPPHEGEMAQLSEKNLGKAVTSMIEFIGKDSPDGVTLPPIYIDDTNIKMAKDIFKNCCLELGFDEDFIKIHSLVYLFYVLRNAAHNKAFEEKAFPCPSIPEAEFEKDVYDHVKGIACKFHNTTDAFIHCTMSKAIRKIFIMCDHCCDDLQIEMIPGRHIPKNASSSRLRAVRPPSQLSRPSSSMSNCSNRNMSSNGVNTAQPNHAIPSCSRATSAEVRAPTRQAPSTSGGANYASAATTNGSGNTDASGLGTTRRPVSSSVAMNLNTAQNYNSNFPALGVASNSNRGRPQSFGRGRGRILNM